MILDTTITIYSASVTKDANGAVLNTYSTSMGSELANIQPYKPTEVESQIWGLSDYSSNAKMCYTRKPSNVALGRQVVHESIRYDIKNVGFWVDHYESVLIPVQGV